jgi:hypothetical protein
MFMELAWHQQRSKDATLGAAGFKGGDLSKLLHHDSMVDGCLLTE